MEIEYKVGVVPEIDEVIVVYNSSGINRPTADRERWKKIYDHSNLVVTAWHESELVGIGRSLTDFAYCCYLSDLAVKKEYQNSGIGKRLIEITQKEIGKQSMLLLLSAPTAMDYYPKVGFEKVENGFIINRK